VIGRPRLICIAGSVLLPAVALWAQLQLGVEGGQAVVPLDDAAGWLADLGASGTVLVAVPAGLRVRGRWGPVLAGASFSPGSPQTS